MADTRTPHSSVNWALLGSNQWYLACKTPAGVRRKAQKPREFTAFSTFRHKLQAFSGIGENLRKSPEIPPGFESSGSVLRNVPQNEKGCLAEWRWTARKRCRSLISTSRALLQRSQAASGMASEGDGWEGDG